MKSASLLTVALLEEGDIIVARQRARQIAALLGFEAQDQTRIATSVSEIARNAASYGKGGRIEFSVSLGVAPEFLIHVRDRGPGITDISAILEGRFKSEHGMGVGISGSRRLMDIFEVRNRDGGGTEVLLGKVIPRGTTIIDGPKIAEIGEALATSGAQDPTTEIRTQNHELLESLEALRLKQEESDRLNRELEETNRGVVALYGELDAKAAQLSQLNEELEARVAAAVAECQAANDALRQSQKMEAVGQLTGGIAHDFNNLLQIVTGNLEMLSRRLSGGDPKILRAAENAMQGAQRAATLTQRLLAFSRRQPLAPKPIDANHLVESMLDLMRRTLGESIVIETDFAHGLWAVEVDFNQLENALLNLAVNARDAMVAGGTLKISTVNGVVGESEAEDDAAPGQYVALRVSDTGSGMSDETLSKVLEPFFTTKGVGKGTGLGLSMVYGFTRQSGGHLRIESAIGRGTTVSIYLPRFVGEVEIEAATIDVPVHLAINGETILVVEDDEGVRSYTCDVLRELGYSVIEAADGNAAVDILNSTHRVDLLFTDVILGGSMSGREVASQAILLRPKLPILFTTGYARDAIDTNERLGDGQDLLPKPFSYSDLAAKIAESMSPLR
jgi:signal transduction histidine kinase